MLVVTPLAAFLIAVSSVRTRRSAANLAALGVIVMILDTLLIGWGLANRSDFSTQYPFINVSLAFTGPSNFQSFVIDLVLHVDHVTVAALLVAEVCVLGILGWHRV
ncbi:MAG TPA: hypothetical protein VEW68_09000, partial [Patescibacteria group bacterium]|nr:hypothetical protein [Patescibacteria group bacterium]